METMRVDLLGPLRVLDPDGTEHPVPAGLRRALLARLALDADRLVPTDVLIDALWPDEPPVNAAGALQTQVSRLRKILGDRLRGESGGYRLTGCAVDTAAFERLAHQSDAAARDGDPHEAERLAREALALWRGPALGEIADMAFVQAAVARLEEADAVAEEGEGARRCPGECQWAGLG
jgi:DNA-binding SARP family transcriptional activator